MWTRPAWLRRGQDVAMAQNRELPGKGKLATFLRNSPNEDRRMRLKTFAMVAAAALCCAFIPDTFGADAPKEQDARAVMNKVRIRQLTQQYNLTPEQQKQCQAILDEQAVQVTAVQKDTTLPMDQRLKKQDAVALEYKAKLRAALNDEQRAKWDEGEAKAAARKKRSAAASTAAKEKEKAKEAPAAPAPEKKTGA